MNIFYICTYNPGLFLFISIEFYLMYSKLIYNIKITVIILINLSFILLCHIYLYYIYN